MSMLSIVVAVILFGALWGAVQGMIMIQPGDRLAADPDADRTLLGVRNHRWFGCYHRLCLYCMAVFAELVIVWTGNFPWDSVLRAVVYLVFSAGCVLLGWEASELWYSWARYEKWIGKREHLVFADGMSMYLSEQETVDIHTDRFCSGLALITITIFL